MTPSVLASLLVTASIVVDKPHHAVEISATATGVNAGTMLEFFWVGPDSDRAYEAMFVTDSDVADIAKALDAAGIPRGMAVGQRVCRFWPSGAFVEIEPSPWKYVADRDGATNRLPVVYTCGTRDSAGLPVANTNMPASVMSFYSLGQSLFLLDDTLDQSVVYGRFTSKEKIEKGTRVTFRISWDGQRATESRHLVLKSGNLKEAVLSLRGSKRDLDVLPDFAPDMTAFEAKAAADALAALDSRAVKVNGFVPGQIFYRGFQPDPAWRDRSKRLTQPVEVRVDATNVVCTLIDEDWSVEGLDPKLTPHDETLGGVARLFKGDTCLFYVRKDEKLGRLYALMKELPKGIRNWYVFID